MSEKRFQVTRLFIDGKVLLVPVYTTLFAWTAPDCLKLDGFDPLLCIWFADVRQTPFSPSARFICADTWGDKSFQTTELETLICN